MKVSRREFILLIILLAAGACYFLYTFLYAPIFTNIVEANLELLDRRFALATYETTIANRDLNELQAEQQALIDSIESTAAPLLPYIDYSEITAFVGGIAQSQNVEIYAVIVAGEELYDTAERAPAAEAVTYPLLQSATLFRSINEGTKTPAVPVPNAVPGGNTISDAVANRLTVEVQLENVTYSQILGFIKQLESYGRAIYLENLSIIEEEAGANLTASLTYGFMQADKLTDADAGLIEIIPAQNTGKSDPFRAGAQQAPQIPETPETSETSETPETTVPQDTQEEQPAA